MGWTCVLVFSYGTNVLRYKAEVAETARIQARAAIERDILFRNWTAGHGGVYVPITPETQPNEFLRVPERDVLTETGRRLTLINPSFMVRQIYELGQKRQELYGHLTNLDPLRPANGPDDWERSTLHAFKAGAPERDMTLNIDGKPIFRFMKPLLAEEGCLLCHDRKKYAPGDVLGGISVAIPLSPLLEIERRHVREVALAHAAVWLVGMLGMGIGARSLQIQTNERRKAEERVRHLAFHDALTELPNRRLFLDRLEHALAETSRYNRKLALLFVDLDGFKSVNDDYGHDAGDRVLLAVAGRLKICCRAADTVSRLGGDEFGIILSNVEEEAAALQVAQRIVEDLAQPFGNIATQLGASVGVSLAPADGSEGWTLVKKADKAMYAAKRAGKNGVQRYTPSMERDYIG